MSSKPKIATATFTPTTMSSTLNPKIAIVYYSMYGHVRTLALEEKKGLESVGCDVTLLRCPETLSAEVLSKMSAPPGIGADDAEATAAQLADYDGLLFGIPTRFGMAAAQVKAFLDSTGGLWGKNALLGKPAGVFFSTGTQGGGQETTALTFVTQLTHHGMIFVPLGYATPKLFNMDEVHGGSPYGAGTLAGADGSRQPSTLEKEIAAAQGAHFGTIAVKLATK